MIKTLLLDLDDTILDFHAAERVALSSALSELGIEPTERLLSRYKEINRSCWERLERGELTREQVLTLRFKLLFDEFGYTVSPCEVQSLYEYKLSLEHQFMQGAPEMLDSLYGKYKLYIASNGTASVQDRRIADTGIAKYFDGIFISQRIGANKPEREFFDRCFAEIDGFEKGETMIVGDSLSSDILGGKNADILTCYFNPHARPNTTDINPDFEIRSLDELIPLLERL
ncbi:MAG: YjjG family noncanonical pyrimidine nucleotidase [Clostridia bacterium]|nr:YjjG family noncanonical pyrimidine nucleotidase [Clostridia bacterium]